MSNAANKKENNGNSTAAEIAALLGDGAEEPLPPSAPEPAPAMIGMEPNEQRDTADPIDMLPKGETNSARNAKRAPKAPPVAPTSPKQALAAMLPPSQRLHVYRRGRDGSMAYIQDYDINDLKGHGNIQAFLKKYVVPMEKIEPGQTEVDYHLYIQSSGKREPESWGSVKVAVAPPANGEGNTAELLRTMQQILNDKSGQPAQKDPLDQMDKMFGLTEKMTEKAKSGGDAMMPLMFMMMMQQQNQQPKTDPALEIIKRKLDDLERKESEKLFQQALSAPQPPMPPPAEDKFGALLVEMQKSNTAMQLKMMELAHQKPEKNEPSFIQQMDFVLRAVKSDTPPMGMKDVLELFPKMKELIVPKDDQKDSFEKMIEHMKLLKLVREEFIGPQGQQGDGGGFWDFAKTLIQSDLGAKIAQGIEQDQTNNANKNKPKQQQQVDPNAPLEIPETFAEHAKAIEEAPDIGKRVGATFQGLRHLWGVPGFRPHITKLLDLMKSNKKTEAIEQLKNILDGLCEAEAISQNSVDEVLKAADTFWVPICQRMGFKEVTADPTQPAPAPVPSPTGTPAAQPVTSVTQIKSKSKPVPEAVPEPDEGGDDSEVTVDDEHIKKNEHKPVPVVTT